MLGVYDYSVDNNSGFEDVLQNVDMVFSTHSTISIPVVLNDIPLCCLLYRSEPVEPICGWYYYGDLNVSLIIDEMISPDPDRLHFQKALVQDLRCKNLVDVFNEKVSPDFKKIEFDDAILKILESPFNFNFQYFIYKLYLSLKANFFVKKIRSFIIRKG